MQKGNPPNLPSLTVASQNRVSPLNGDSWAAPLTKSSPFERGLTFSLLIQEDKNTNNKTTPKFLCCYSFGPQTKSPEPLRNWSHNHRVCNTGNCWGLCVPFYTPHPPIGTPLSPSVQQWHTQHQQMAQPAITHTEQALFSSTAAAGHFDHLLCTRFSPQLLLPLCPTPGLSAVS